MKVLKIGALILTFLAASTLKADDVPQFFQDSMPEHAMGEILKSWSALISGEGAALDSKTQELIGLAVAAQIPCEYCVFSHKAKLKKLGASEAEMREAVAIAAYIRMFSTMLYGAETDLDKFSAEFQQLLQ